MTPCAQPLSRRKGPRSSSCAATGHAYIYRVAGRRPACGSCRAARHVTTDAEAGARGCSTPASIRIARSCCTTCPIAARRSAGRATRRRRIVASRAVVTREDSRGARHRRGGAAGRLLAARRHVLSRLDRDSGRRADADLSRQHRRCGAFSCRRAATRSGSCTRRRPLSEGLRITLLAVSALLVWACGAALRGPPACRSTASRR